MHSSTTNRTVPIAITVLALLDGALHVLLSLVLFGGGPPGGGPPPGLPPGGPGPGSGPPGMFFPLPLDELLLLNGLGYVVLILTFWLAAGGRGAKRWVVDVGLIVYTLVAVVGWVAVGMPNPMGLGYVSKGIEIALIVVLVVHLASLLSPSARGSHVDQVVVRSARAE